jgi:biotin transporter BioY
MILCIFVADESKKLGNCCSSQSTSPCIVLIAVGLIVIAGFTVLAILLKIRLDQANKVGFTLFLLSLSIPALLEKCRNSTV